MGQNHSLRERSLLANVSVIISSFLSSLLKRGTLNQTPRTLDGLGRQSRFSCTPELVASDGFGRLGAASFRKPHQSGSASTGRSVWAPECLAFRCAHDNRSYQSNEFPIRDENRVA